LLPDAHLKPPSGIFRPYLLRNCRTLPANASEPLSGTHPVECVIEHVDTKVKHTIRSRYLLGCDGAKSHVRRCIAGGEEGDGEWKGLITMQGEATDIIWGVVDARVKTNFRACFVISGPNRG
jgi:2-polyprenyl-6-methoxyphenol hydroxylase-like FAD-dependent oxidoreductase